MFDYIKGRITANRNTTLVVENQGIGYLVRCSLQTSTQLPAGIEAQLYLHQHTSQEQTQLFGFAEPGERDLFLQIIAVSGIGPKIALAVLSALTERELLQAVQTGDEERLTTVPGVGKMTARRLLLELSKRLPRLDPATITAEDVSEQSAALQALEALGFNRTRVEPQVRQLLAESPEMTVEDILRGVLQKHGRQ